LRSYPFSIWVGASRAQARCPISPIPWSPIPRARPISDGVLTVTAANERGRALLVPGNDLCADFYRSLLEALADRGLTTTALTLPAFVGRGGPTTWESLTDHVLSSAQTHLGAGGLLIGHSLGGLLALLAALRDPPSVDRLALLEPAVAPLAALARAAGARYQRDVVEKDRDRFTNWTGAFRRLNDPDTYPQASLDLYLRARREGDPTIVGSLLTTMPELYPLPFRSLKTPTLLLRGAKSGWRAAIGGVSLATLIPSARSQVIPNAAHWLVGENDSCVADALVGFSGCCSQAGSGEP
jgi:pimeloyl-ACP methyl ester carboxylesterase